MIKTVRRSFVFALLALVLVPTRANGVNLEETSKGGLASPVLLTEAGDGVRVQNVGTQPIVQLSLGCFFTHGSTQFAIHWFSSRHLSLLPTMRLRVADGNERKEMLERCRSYFPNYRPSLIVRNVIFADGTGWPPPPAIPGGWAENIHGTPLTLSSTPSGYQVLNASDRFIAQYTLACVQIRENQLKILSRYSRRPVSLEPGTRIVVSVFDGRAPDIVEDCVFRLKEKLAVVEVEFKDGSIWRPEISQVNQDR